MARSGCNFCLLIISITAWAALNPNNFFKTRNCSSRISARCFFRDQKSPVAHIAYLYRPAQIVHCEFPATAMAHLLKPPPNKSPSSQKNLQMRHTRWRQAPRHLAHKNRCAFGQHQPKSTFVYRVFQKNSGHTNTISKF